jgi:hypothetical protein
MKTETAFANVLASLALAVSLASAGWSVYAFAMSSEVRALRFDEVNFFSEESVPQLKIDVTLANLAYGDFDDVAQRQELLLDVGERTLLFVAMRQGNLALVRPDPEGGYPVPQFPCYAGGVGLAVCPVSDIPTASLPAGEIVTLTPVFELAEAGCGLDDCTGATLATIAPMLEGTTRVTYRVHTMRDGVQTATCDLHLTAEDVDYLRSVGWTNPRCLAQS